MCLTYIHKTLFSATCMIFFFECPIYADFFVFGKSGLGEIKGHSLKTIDF